VFRFGAVLTVALIALGLLVGGVLTSSLVLVYAAIGAAALAGILLAIGVLFRRDEIFGSSPARPEPHQPPSQLVTAAAGSQVAAAGAGPQAAGQPREPDPAGPELSAWPEFPAPAVVPGRYDQPAPI